MQILRVGGKEHECKRESRCGGIATCGYDKTRFAIEKQTACAALWCVFDKMAHEILRGVRTL
jgi:hypothetical protein